MCKIILIHSFRRGTGKTTLTANLAALFAQQGRRVGVIDANLQSPAIHLLFGLQESQITTVLNDYLAGRCEIEQTAYDVTPQLLPEAAGRIYLLPASTSINEIKSMWYEGYSVDLLMRGIESLIESLQLDVLMIDPHAGLTEETLSYIAHSDRLAIVLRLDHQEYQGTGITLSLARQLDVPSTMLIINEIPPIKHLKQLKTHLEQTYHTPVAAILPHSDQLMALASTSLFVLHYPQHPITATLKELTARLAGKSGRVGEWESGRVGE
ncbi:MAG: MinD/ParA family ATP-binding protein [Ardenticatenaceae bacterium]